MKILKRIILIFLLFFLSISTFSQWKSLNPIPTGSYLNTAYMIDNSNIIVGGDGGTILKSSDGGTKWELIQSNTGNNIHGFSFIDSRNGWAVGDNGEILKTADGGNSWEKQASGELVALYGICFSSATIGIAVGTEGTVLKTTDGGNSWERKTISTTEDLWDVCFLDANTAILVGNAGKVFKSANAGNSWSVRTSSTSRNLYSVDFTDVNTGWIVGQSGPIIKTTDGGTSWFELTGTSNTYNEIQMLNSTTGYVVGSWGLVKKTIDGGATWNQVLTLNSNPDDYDPLTDGYSGLYFFDEQHGFAVGSKGSIIKTTDGGANFNSVRTFFSTDTFRNVYFLNKDTGIMFGEGSIYRTLDGGTNWSKIASIAISNPRVKFFDKNNGLLVANYNTNFITSDGGVTWTKDATNKLSGFIYSQTKAIRLNGSTIQYTTNGGTTWTDASRDAYYDYFNDLILTSENVGYASANYENTIVKTTDGGKNWFAAGTVSWPNKLCFVDDNTGWASGSGGLYKTINGGTTWTQLSTGATKDITDIKFLDASEGYISTKEGGLFKTIDGGATWTKQLVSTSSDLNSLFLLDKTHAWAVGWNGTILTIATFKPALTASTDNKTRKYGEENPAFSISYSGFTGGDTKANITEPTISCTATKNSDAGSYAISLAGGSTTKYSLKLVNGTLTVEKAVLTVSVDNKSRRPNEANPVYTYSYSGFVNGDDENDLDVKPTISCSATESSAIGNYDIIASGGNDNNYTFEYVKGILSVNNKETQVISFPVIPAKTYGDGSVALNATSSASLTVTYASSNTDVATISGSTLTIKNAGTTEITASQAGNDSYNIAADVKRTLTVQKAILTIAAENKNKKEGEANPDFTFAYIGFVNGETDNVLNTKPTATCNALNNSPSGTYLIIPAGADDNNYDFNYINGKLTIGTVSVSDIAGSGIEIYPIPAKDFVNVRLLGVSNYKVSIYSLTGSLVISKNSSRNESIIDIRALPKGLYLLKIMDGSSVYSKRLVKE